MGNDRSHPLGQPRPSANSIGAQHATLVTNSYTSKALVPISRRRKRSVPCNSVKSRPHLTFWEWYVEQLLKMIADHPERFDDRIHLPCELRAMVEALRDQRVSPQGHAASRARELVLILA